MSIFALHRPEGGSYVRGGDTLREAASPPAFATGGGAELTTSTGSGAELTTAVGAGAELATVAGSTSTDGTA